MEVFYVGVCAVARDKMQPVWRTKKNPDFIFYPSKNVNTHR